MNFTTISFLLFFISFFFIYWFVVNQNLKHQNILIILGSYIFYGWADWHILFFLGSFTLLNFFIGISLEKTSNLKTKKFLLFIGLILGIGALAFFKYYNFFVSSFNLLFQFICIPLNFSRLNIFLPIGLSFFTFKMVSYQIDIYYGKIKPCRDWIVFFAYVSFFPSLLAGPIDRAKMFIPQLEKKRVFDYSQATDGLRQILWGLFKKIVIADNSFIVTDFIFKNYHEQPASSLLIGAFIFTIQVYADFSGYSDIAIGLSRLIGFNITKNFDYPFFAQNISEFWKKWHISLTLWLVDYVFAPLSFALRDFQKFGLILAVIINLIICGLWHGANWNYVMFGFINGCFFIPLILRGTLNKKTIVAKGKALPSIKEAINMTITFTFVILAFIVFKSESIWQAYDYICRLFSTTLFSIPTMPHCKKITLIAPLFIPIMLVMEWIGRDKQHALEDFTMKWPIVLRWTFYIVVLFVIGVFTGSNQQFFYFQF